MESSNCLQMVHQKNALLGALCIFVTKLGNLVFFWEIAGKSLTLSLQMSSFLFGWYSDVSYWKMWCVCLILLVLLWLLRALVKSIPISAKLSCANFVWYLLFASYIWFLNYVIPEPEAELCPLWIKKFNRELMRTLSFSEHETFDHPVACEIWHFLFLAGYSVCRICSCLCFKLLLTGLLVVSSMDKEPVNKFVDLFNTNQLPSLLNEGIMDPQILKHYLVLHDQQEGPQDMYCSSPFFLTKEDTLI